MSKIYLIRHGQTDWNVTGRIQGCRDIPLNERGRRQALLLAENMEAYRPELVLSSPLCRARETARAVAERLQIPLECWRDLEEIRYGSWEGMTVEEIRREFPEEYDSWWSAEGTGRPPGGESRREGLERGEKMVRRIQKLVHSRGISRLAVVSHGALICCMLPAFLQGAAPLEEGFSVHNGGITALEMDPETGQCRVEMVNQWGYLPRQDQ